MRFAPLTPPPPQARGEAERVATLQAKMRGLLLQGADVQVQAAQRVEKGLDAFPTMTAFGPRLRYLPRARPHDHAPRNADEQRWNLAAAAS